MSGATHDVIVIGAGPAGGVAAIELARQGRRVALIEKSPFPRRKVCGEFMSASNAPVLRRLGIEADWEALAGPEVRRVALYAGESVIDAPMPARHGHGRALGREVLDTLLRDVALARGAEILQPCRAAAHAREDGLHVIEAHPEEGAPRRLAAPVLVAAHGSWERGELPTSLGKAGAPSDMLGFKAYFRGGAMPAGTMPLLAFPGGYGGMVWADRGRLSLSCCIRRDRLSALREGRSARAAEAMEAHLLASCRGVREALAGAEPDGSWLATGPIRPGIRPRHAGGVFSVGNVAGEAHPVIAEGISMAIQSASLMAQALSGLDLRDASAVEAAGRRYSAAWARQFAPRIHAARAIAALAMRPRVLELSVGALPALLTFGASLSGKTKLTALR